MSDKEINNYINKENKKYINCCSMMMYFYLKSENEKINIVSVATELGGNIEENKVIIKRILRGMGKRIYFNYVSLSYSDYLKLERNVKGYKEYKFQLFPYLISVMSFLISICALFINFVDDKIVMLLVVIIIVLMTVFYLTIISD